MSRRPPSDAFTRFTSSQPHAMSKPSFSSNLTAEPRPSPASSSSAPANETPAEKVARLRAASRAARAAQISPLDRVIAGSRTWADRAHRITTYGLIGLTGVSAVVAVYSLTSLVAHNRRQKRAWIERELDRLHEAQQAFLRGEADAEQLHLLEQERAGEEIAKKWKEDQDKKKREGMWSKITGLVGAKAAEGEMGVETEAERETREYRSRRDKYLKGENRVEGEITPTRGSDVVAVAPRDSGVKGVGVDSKGRPVPSDRIEYVTQGTDRKGGMLDQLADNAVGAVTTPAESRSWYSWVTGGKS